MTTPTTVKWQNIDTTDTNLFVSISSWATDTGKIPLLDSNGKIVWWFNEVNYFWDWSDWDVIQIQA
jgi:hypothetical protein